MIKPNYVLAQFLSGIEDPFAAKFLWESKHPWSRTRGALYIREALERYPDLVGYRSEMRSCFPHVRILLSSNMAELDRRAMRDMGKQALSRRLEEAHREEFSRYTAEGQTIRYAVGSGPTLKDDEAVILFGRAIYLPGADEVPRYHLHVHSPEKEATHLCDIYPNQRLDPAHG